MNQRKEDTALGVARARFVDSLPRKAEEIEAAVRAMRAAPDDAGAREELRKRFHALYASAQVFRIEGLAESLKRCLVVIDEARDQSRALAEDDLQRLEDVLGSLSELATGQRPSIIPNMDDAVDNSRYSVPRPSALGVTPHRPPPPAAARPAPPAIPAPRTASTSSPQTPAAPPRPVSSPRIPAPRPTSSPAIPAPRPVSSPRIPAPRPKSSPTIPAPRPKSSPTIPAPRASSPAMPQGGSLSKSPAKSSAFVPKGAGSIPPSKPKPEKRLIASRSAAKVEVDRVLVVLMVGGEPIAQRIAPLFPSSQVEILKSASEREAVELAAQASPDVVVAAPSFARLVADAFAEAELDHVPRVQLMPPGADVAEYQLRGVMGVIAVNAPPTKMAKLVVETACEAGRLTPQRVEPRPSRRPGDLAGVEAVVSFDEPGITHFVAKELERAGAKVYRASDGERALVLVRATRPQLVLTCSSLPKVDGAEIIRRIGRDPFLTGVRAVVLELEEPIRAKMRAAPGEGDARVEAGAGFVRDWAVEASAARTRLLEAIRAGQIRRARLRGVGAEPLLHALEAAGADVKLELRDTEKTLEIEIRGGRPVVATFTASSGDFVRGDRAFDRIASFVSGRFRLRPAEDDEPKGPPLASDAVARVSREIVRRSVVLELLEDQTLPGATQVELDAELVSASGLDEALTRALESSRTLGSIGTLLGPERARERLLLFAQVGAITGLTSEEGGADLIAEGLARRGEPDLTATLPNDLEDTTPGRLAAPDLVAEVEASAPDVAEVEPPQVHEIEPLPPEAPHVPAEEPYVPAEAAASAAPPMPPLPVPLPEPSEVAAPPPEPAARPSLEVADPPAPSVPRRGLSGGLVAVLATVVVAGLGFAAIEIFDVRSLVGGGQARDERGVAEERAALAPVEEVEEAPKLVDPFPAIARYYGERREGIVDRGVAVPEGHGLVIVEDAGRGEPVDVYLGSEMLGKTPVTKAFPPGRIEITLVRGSDKLFRYVFVEPGVTRVLPAE